MTKITRNTAAINLTRTQKGYVPLKDRFKSFRKDSEREPVTDADFYFQNYANQTLEHADLGLLYPTPGFITRWKNKKNLRGSYITDPEGNLLIGNNHYIIGVEKK